MMTNSLMTAASFNPNSLQPPNAWVGHLPFAAWIIREVSPKIFVELGTHSGNSYFAFCQSVVEANLATQCYAVDTWQGDEHAGRYGEEIFAKVHAHHEEKYARFSRLLRMTFDDATTHFSAESIDLLHIDGLHTYEAVKHDFETWLPQLAPGAVVMFHDTNVRERNFGVWKLWEEIKAHYPSHLEFVHSHGLGTLQCNSVPDGKKLEWLQPEYPHKQEIKNYFSALGSQQLERFGLNELKENAASLRQAVVERDGQITSLNQSVAERDGQIVRLNQAIPERDGRIIRLNYAVAERDGQIATLNQAVAKVDNVIKRILASRSWRLTSPLRFLGRLLRGDWAAAKASLKNFARKMGSQPHTQIETTAEVALSSRKVRPVLENTASSEAVEQLTFLSVTEPIVSVVIPVFNNWKYTHRCLKALRERSGNRIPYEVIIADDASTDETSSMLTRFKGLTVVQNEQNLGFLLNCNRAAKSARGRYLVLLNNDTEVQEGWLEALYAVFTQFDRVGIVGGKLLSPDGRVQEAGGVMWHDGWGYPYGRFADPATYDLNYVKEVDCLIGACLMIDRDLFCSLGGFDERYAPAHYEEFDLEFAARVSGYKVLYQPKAVILHHGSVSGGTAFRDRQSACNHQKFCEKWRSVLPLHARSETELIVARDRSQHQKRILVIDGMVPEHDKHAGAVTIRKYLELLVEMGFKVIFLPHDDCQKQPYTEQLQQLGIEVVYGDVPFVAWIKRFGPYLDYVWMARPDVSTNYINHVIEHSKAIVIYYTHDLHYLRELRRYELEGSPERLLESNRLKAIEHRLFHAADIILTPSNAENRIICDLVPGKRVLTIPAYFYDTDEGSNGSATPFHDRQGLLFLGGFAHAPNVDAVKWFVQEIWPMVRSKLPQAIFYIAGSNVPEEVYQLESDGVVILGHVADLEPLFARCRVFVAPLRYGAGVKGKIVTSLRYGLPVVTTPIGNEGMDLKNGHEILLADDAVSFARNVTTLYLDENLWYGLVQGGKACLGQHFSKCLARRQLHAAMGILVERCAVCGRQINYVPSGKTQNLREEQICQGCGALSRTSYLAQTLLLTLGLEALGSLCRAEQELAKLRIYEIGHAGAIHDILSPSPNFVCSEFFDDIPPGDLHPSGVRCEDVERLSFNDAALDIVISQDVFEHVANPARGLEEIHRVLRPGGYHVFTVPYANSLLASQTRASFVDGNLRHHLPPVYHGHPIRQEGALVFTDFGQDFVRMQEAAGFEVAIHECTTSDYPGGYVAVFASKTLTR